MTMGLANVAANTNMLRSRVLKYLDGAVSLQMQPLRLRWVKVSLLDTWRWASQFLDLSDFRTYRATGDDARLITTSAQPD